MSTERIILENTGRHNDDLKIVSFYGGHDKGEMIQLSQICSNTIQLTQQDAFKVIAELTNWLSEKK